MSDGELMTADEARAWRDDGVDGNREEITRLCDTIIALHELLGAAARGELPRCECWCGCSRLGTREAGSGAAGHLCDVCLTKHEHVANDRHERGDWRDLPHAAALRAAMGGGA